MSSPPSVAMPAYGRLGQTLVQQMEQERGEHRDDLLADVDVCGLDVPYPRPVVQVRAGLAKPLRVMRRENGCDVNAGTGVDHVADPLAQCLLPLSRLRLRRSTPDRG